jgi:hypothetical protein
MREPSLSHPQPFPAARPPGCPDTPPPLQSFSPFCDSISSDIALRLGRIFHLSEIERERERESGKKRYASVVAESNLWGKGSGIFFKRTRITSLFRRAFSQFTEASFTNIGYWFFFYLPADFPLTHSLPATPFSRSLIVTLLFLLFANAPVYSRHWMILYLSRDNSRLFNHHQLFASGTNGKINFSHTDAVPLRWITITNCHHCPFHGKGDE